MSNVDDLQKDVQLTLDSLRSSVESANDLTWKPSEGFLPIMYRSILRRQFEYLDAISYLVAEERGYAAPPLLRPSSEELIWTKYFTSISSDDAEQLLQNIANLELIDSIKAQDDYAGRAVTEELGLAPALLGSEKRKEAIRAKLTTLGEKLNWNHHATRNGFPPSLRWLAKTTRQTELYNYIYHATSRFVHFSGVELLCRAWGKPGHLSIRSSHFRDYWASFSLYWGLRLFAETTVEVCNTPGMPDEGVDVGNLLAAARRISQHGKVPIITAEELKWPE